MRSLLWGAVAMVLVGCGSVAIATDAVPDGVIADAAGMPDAGLPGVFGPPIRIAELSGGTEEDDPTLTGDMLEIIFDSDRTGGQGGGDFWFSRRATVGDPWPAPQLIAELASPADDTTAEISRDGLTLYFASNRTGGSREIYRTTRPTRAALWSPPIRIPELSSPVDDSAPTVTTDELTIFFSSNRLGSYDVFVATRTGVMMPWGPAMPVAGFDSPAVGDSEQWISDDALDLYVSSTRPGAMASAIWFATRATVADTFGPATVIGELDSSMADGDPWLSPDQRTIVFARQSPPGGFDLYVATR